MCLIHLEKYNKNSLSDTDVKSNRLFVYGDFHLIFSFAELIFSLAKFLSGRGSLQKHRSPMPALSPGATARHQCVTTACPPRWRWEEKTAGKWAREVLQICGEFQLQVFVWADFSILLLLRDIPLGLWLSSSPRVMERHEDLKGFKARSWTHHCRDLCFFPVPFAQQGGDGAVVEPGWTRAALHRWGN